MWSNCWPLPPLYRLHVCDRLEVFEFHVLKPCRMYDEGFFYQSGYCVKTFVSYWVATFLSPAPNEVIQVSLESHWVKSWIEAGRAKEKKIESHDEDDGPNSGFSSQASISSLRLGVFLPFFHGCRNTSLIKVFSLLIEDNRLMRSACRSYKKQQLQNVLVFFEKKLYIQAPSL